MATKDRIIAGAIGAGAALASAALGYWAVRKARCGKLKPPIRVLISGAAGQIGYSLVPLVANGTVFGHNQPVILHLLDITQALKSLNGVVMEIQDGAYPLVRNIIATDDLKTACSQVDVAILVGGRPRQKNQERKDLLLANSPIFIGQGKALNDYASKNVKVLVVANPANTNCLIAALNATDIPKKNFTCLTRLDMNRARGLLADKLQVPSNKVKNVIIWGNHSSTQYPDLSHATYEDANGKVAPVAPQFEEKWIQGEFITTVQKRGAAILEARNFSSAMSAANAVADHLKDWLFGTRDGEYVSMGVWSDGSYGVAKDIIFSFPVKCKNGEYEIVQGLKLSKFDETMIKATEKELLEEKSDASAKP